MTGRGLLLIVLVACDGGRSNVVDESGSGPAPAESTGPDPVAAGPTTDWVGRPLAREEAPPPPPVADAGPVDDDHNVYCSPQEGSAVDRNWWTFGDRDIIPWGADCVAGTSDSFVERVHDLDDTDLCAVSWTGTTTEAISYGFAGLGTNFAQSDWSSAQGLVLMVRGDGRSYRVELPMGAQMEAAANAASSCGDPNRDAYGMDFACGNGSMAWEKVIVPWKALKQNGWGEKVAFNPKDLRQLQVKTTFRPAEAFRCDVYIAEIL